MDFSSLPKAASVSNDHDRPLRYDRAEDRNIFAAMLFILFNVAASNAFTLAFLFLVSLVHGRQVMLGETLRAMLLMPVAFVVRLVGIQWLDWVALMSFYSVVAMLSFLFYQSWYARRIIPACLFVWVTIQFLFGASK